MVRIPRKIRYAAPAIFTTVNASRRREEHGGQSQGRRRRMDEQARTRARRRRESGRAATRERVPGHEGHVRSGCLDHERRDRDEPREIHHASVA
jgi:hypothetical protein